MTDFDLDGRDWGPVFKSRGWFTLTPVPPPLLGRRHNGHDLDLFACTISSTEIARSR